MSIASNDPIATDQTLPFRILIADASNLPLAVSLRSEAYGRHLPELGKALAAPEEFDYEPGTEVLLALGKSDGRPIATARIHTNLLRPLPLQASVELPAAFAGQRLLEVTRLGRSSQDAELERLVMLAIFKAIGLRCEAMGIDRMVIVARSPVDRLYERMLFEDIGERRAFHPMRHVGNLPHRVMTWEIDYRARNHPLYDFYYGANHPDIDLTPRPMERPDALPRAA